MELVNKILLQEENFFSPKINLDKRKEYMNQEVLRISKTLKDDINTEITKFQNDLNEFYIEFNNIIQFLHSQKVSIKDIEYETKYGPFYIIINLGNLQDEQEIIMEKRFPNKVNIQNNKFYSTFYTNSGKDYYIKLHNNIRISY